MKKLLLMRHAAANSQILEQDLNRTLSNVGIKEVSKAKEFIAGMKLDKILVSPSIRTMQTKDMLLNGKEYIRTEVNQQLYLANAETILNIIQAEDNNNECLLVIAHNPAIYQLALKIANKKQDNYELLLDNNMPTCCIVEIDFENIFSWHDAAKNSGTIVKIFAPNN